LTANGGRLGEKSKQEDLKNSLNKREKTVLTVTPPPPSWKKTPKRPGRNRENKESENGVGKGKQF